MRRCDDQGLRRSLFGSLAFVGLGIAIAPACSADAGENQASCPGDLATVAALAATLPDFPKPLAPGLEGPAVLATMARNRFVVDPDPTTRGEHAALVLERTRECEVRLVPVPALPLAGPVTDPDTTTFGPEIGARDADPTRGGLFVAGADISGGSGDGANWAAIFLALDLRAQPLETPSQARFEASLASTCAAIDRAGLLVLVLAGQGTQGDGGGFVLATLADGEATPEVIAYRRVASLLSDHCAHLGAIVWVVDASHFELELAEQGSPSAVDPLTLPLSGPPLLILRASDRTAVDAARASRHGPGLFGQVLARVLPRARGHLCSQGRLANAEIVALFQDPTAAGEPLVATATPSLRLRAELLRERWEHFGLPALARLDAAGELVPARSVRLQSTLARAVPMAPLLLRGTLPPGTRCTSLDDCARCELAPCARSACIGGLCRTRPNDGADCDDGNDCTGDDRCNDGACHGAILPCDDDNPCTDEACEPGRGCVAHASPGRSCDDRDPCTEVDACGATGACVGANVACDDGDPCTVDSCSPPDGADPGGCIFLPKNLPCDDGDPCTLADQCRNLVCSGTRKTCSDDNDCTADRCDASGECRFDPVADLAACDDGDPCTSIDRCREGGCKGLAAACDDGLGCTFDSCDAGRCSHLPAPGLCLSPTGTRCVAVGERPVDAPCLVCAATGRLAPTGDGEACPNDGIACTIDVCDAGACTHRDGPETCHSGEGRCVVRGENLTPCLVCQGGGVVTAVAPQTPCDNAVGCAAGTCDGLGTCQCGAAP